MAEAFICDYVRTPIGRFAGSLSSVRADDLGAVPIRALCERNPAVDWEALDEVTYGCANQAGEDNRNVARMCEWIDRARDAGSDIVVFSEMCVPGYILGDRWEVDALVEDFAAWSDTVREASDGIAVVFGNVAIDRTAIGEDGRIADVRRGVEAGNAKAVRIGAHTIKGAATHFGAQRVVEAAIAMEEFGRDGKIAEAQDALPAFEAEVDALVAAIAEADSIDCDNLGDA